MGDNHWANPHTAFRVFTRRFIRKSASVAGRWLHNQPLPPLVQGTLDRITDVVPQPLFHQVIREGYRATKVVYLFMHTNTCPYMYVGSAWSGILARASQHFSATHRMQQLPTVSALRRMKKECAYRLYSHFIMHGLRDMIIIPLDILHPGPGATKLLIQEQVWIDRLGTLMPYGYNFKRAVKDAVRGSLHRLSGGTAHLLFQGYNSYTLFKLLIGLP